MPSSSQSNGPHQQQADDLKTTQHLLRATMDASMDMIQVFEAIRNQQGEIVDFTWIFTNQAAEKMYGDMIGKSLLQVQPGMVEEGIFKTFKQVVETGLPQQYEMPYGHEPFDGWFFQSIVKLGDGVATTTADITGRKNAEQALQQSKALLQDIIDAPNIGIAVYKALRNNQGQIIDFVHEYINRASLTMLGGEDFTGKLFTDHGENGILQLPKLIDVIETGIGNSYLREAYFRGHQVWFAITNSPLDDDRLVHTWEDITQREKAEEELKEQAHFIKSVTEMMPDVVSVVEFPSRTILYTNRDTMTWVGFDADRLSGMSFEDRIQLFHPDDLPAIQDFYGRFGSLKDHQETSVEYRLKNNKGEWILLSLRGQIFSRDEQGHPTQLLFVGQNITAQRKAEQDILHLKDEIAQKATDKYYSLFESIDEGVHISELLYNEAGQPIDWRYLEVNAVFERQTGLTNAVGQLGSVLSPNTEPYWLEAYDQVLKTGQSVRFENHHEATGRWYSAYASRVGGAGSHLFAVIFDDITDRKRTEEALRESEQQKALLLTLSDRLQTLTRPGLVQEVALQLLGEHLGLSRAYFFRAEADEQGWHHVIESAYQREPGQPSMIGRHSLKPFGSWLFEGLEQGQVVEVANVAQVSGLTPDELAVYQGIGVTAFLNVPLQRYGTYSAGIVVHSTVPRVWKPTELVLIREVALRTWDSIERTRAEETLRESEKRFRLAIEATELATWEWNLETDEVYWNEQHFRLFGMEPKPNPLRPDEFFSHVHPRERERLRNLLEQAIALRSVYNTEFCAVREDGSQRWLSGYGRITEERDGQPIRMSGVMFDVDERRRTEDALRVADQRKDEFLAMLAHELRNPMSTLRSGLQILTITDAKDQTSRDTIAMMNRQTDHLVRMVDDLLDVSRISQGKIELKTQRINLVEVVAQAAESVQVLYREQGRILQVELPRVPIEVEGDGDRLSQVVTNLLTNGARYTGEQGQVWLTLEHRNREAILQVRDNGIGLAANQLESIFELFVQVDNSLARSKGGLGLGLTLVKRLVELHGGRVSVQSEGLGQGSTFTVHLPMPATAAEAKATPAPTVHDPSAARRILVIDDNADAGFTLTMLLKLKGYEAHSRTSGRVGLEAAEALQPAAILLDIGMPDLDGYATCGLIRQQSWGQGIVVIALTGYGQAEDRQRTREAGFDGHLVKPVDLGELTKLLTDLLEKGSH